MDPTKHYKDKKTIDGPWRGGVTTHTFEKDGKLYTVVGPYNDVSGYECIPSVG